MALFAIHPKSLCTARCSCGRRCCKPAKHLWSHRCLRHGNF